VQTARPTRSLNGGISNAATPSQHLSQDGNRPEHHFSVGRSILSARQAFHGLARHLPLFGYEIGSKQ
jgi:hypothetical protein